MAAFVISDGSAFTVHASGLQLNQNQRSPMSIDHGPISQTFSTNIYKRSVTKITGSGRYRKVWAIWENHYGTQRKSQVIRVDCKNLKINYIEDDGPSGVENFWFEDNSGLPKYACTK
jgi:hypothetical protein